MTVQSLIAELQKAPLDYEVMVNVAEGELQSIERRHACGELETWHANGLVIINVQHPFQVDEDVI